MKFLVFLVFCISLVVSPNPVKAVGSVARKAIRGTKGVIAGAGNVVYHTPGFVAKTAGQAKDVALNVAGGTAHVAYHAPGFVGNVAFHTPGAVGNALKISAGAVNDLSGGNIGNGLRGIQKGAVGAVEQLGRATDAVGGALYHLPGNTGRVLAGAGEIIGTQGQRALNTAGRVGEFAVNTVQNTAAGVKDLAEIVQENAIPVTAGLAKGGLKNAKWLAVGTASNVVQGAKFLSPRYVSRETEKNAIAFSVKGMLENQLKWLPKVIRESEILGNTLTKVGKMIMNFLCKCRVHPRKWVRDFGAKVQYYLIRIDKNSKPWILARTIDVICIGRRAPY